MLFVLERKETNLLSNLTRSYTKFIKDDGTKATDFESILKDIFNQYRSEDRVVVDANLKNGEVMALEDNQTHYSWIIWVDSGDKELILLSKLNLDLFTDLVISILHYDSEWISQQMLENDPIYKFLKAAPTSPSSSNTKSGYVIAR
jgi:hypothetical protein